MITDQFTHKFLLASVNQDNTEKQATKTLQYVFVDLLFCGSLLNAHKYFLVAGPGGGL